MRFPCSRRQAARARRYFSRYLCTQQFPAEFIAELESAVGEAIANSIEHGYPEAQFFELRCSVTPDNVFVEVEDDGPGFRGESVSSLPGATRGFGFGIMRASADELYVLKNGRLIRFVKRAPRELTLATTSEQPAFEV